MAEIHVKKLPAGYVTLIEDPVLANNRLFISTQGHDTTTLAPLFQKNWSWNFNDQYQTSYGDDQRGEMWLEKGVVTCWADNESQGWDNPWMSYYHVTLDWSFFPVKPGWKTINGKVLMTRRYTIPGYGTEIGSGTTGHLLYASTDITAGAGAITQTTSYAPNYYCYEDVSNQRIWGIWQGAASGGYLHVTQTYETQLGTGATITPSNNDKSIQFFLGVDDQGFLHFVSVQDGTSTTYYSQYTFWKVNPTSYAVTQIINQSYRSNTSRIAPRSWPSNIRRASSTRRVLYSCHYDASSNLAPIRYVWNPADGSVTATNCTMTYSGANTYGTYSAMYTTEANQTYNNMSWHQKGYQFTVDGVNYITFWLTDKYAHAGSGSSRWSTSLKRTMMTYTIGAGTGDDVLTYHSSYTFPTVNDIPRDFMPINSQGTQMMVPVTLQMKFFSFNSSTGWAPTGTYPYEFRCIGLDQTNRIWGMSREKGNTVLHFITPTIPVTINVVMASSSFTFTGSNISTSCTVDAYGSDGLRISTAVNLAIDGNTMIFTTNSTKNLTITTSASASTVVNLTITGGGVNNIIASVDI
jgi:hypothetical protein